MTDARSSLVDDDHRLRFSCACASAVPIGEDPWVAISQQRKLNDGTKEQSRNSRSSLAFLLRPCIGTSSTCLRTS
jgi:hypothetical protein